MKIKKSDSYKLRKKWDKKGYELINITPLLKTELGCSGWCNGLNEPDETIHHVQLLLRNEVIANIDAAGVHIIDDDCYLLHKEEEDALGCDFIIYRKIKKNEIN